MDWIIAFMALLLLMHIIVLGQIKDEQARIERSLRLNFAGHFDALNERIGKSIDEAKEISYALEYIKSEIKDIHRDQESTRKHVLKISRQNMMDEINRGKYDARLKSVVARHFHEYVLAGNQMPPKDS